MGFSTHQWAMMSKGAPRPVNIVGTNFLPQAGYSVEGTAVGGTTVSVSKPTGGFGTGPTVLVYADWHSGTIGDVIPTTDVVLGGPFINSDSPRYMPGRDGGASMGINTATYGSVTKQFEIVSPTNYDEWFHSYSLYLPDRVGTPLLNGLGPINFKRIWQTSDGIYNASSNGSDKFFIMFGGALSGAYAPKSMTTTTLELADTDTRSTTNWANGNYYVSVGGKARLITNVAAKILTVDPPWDTPLPTGNYYVAVGNRSSIEMDAGSNSSSGQTLGNMTKAETVFSGWTHLQEYAKADTASPYTATSSLWFARTNANHCGVFSTDTHTMFGTGDRAYYNHVYIPGYLSNFFLTSEYNDYRYDDLYIAVGPGAAKRFILADASTLETSREVYLCPHTSWTDNTVQVLMPYPQEGGTLTGKYLIYFDSDNMQTLVGQWAPA